MVYITGKVNGNLDIDESDIEERDGVFIGLVDTEHLEKIIAELKKKGGQLTIYGLDLKFERR